MNRPLFTCDDHVIENAIRIINDAVTFAVRWTVFNIEPEALGVHIHAPSRHQRVVLVRHISDSWQRRDDLR